MALSFSDAVSTGSGSSEYGGTRYEIMAVHGHAEAKTSEIHTSGVERRNLALHAVESL